MNPKPMRRFLNYGFFNSPELLECSPLARIAFAGLWLWADREGLLEDKPKKLKIVVLPADNCDFNELLNELEKQELIERISAGKTKIIKIPSFKKQQGKGIHWNESQSELVGVLDVPLIASIKSLKGACKYESESVKVSEKEKVVKKKKQIAVEEILEKFHSICTSLPSVSNTEKRPLSPTREKKFRARLDDLKKIDMSMTDYFETIEANNFLAGRKTDFCATFDFISNKTNFDKIMDGNYDRDDRRKTKRGSRSKARKSGETAL